MGNFFYIKREKSSIIKGYADFSALNVIVRSEEDICV